MHLQRTLGKEVSLSGVGLHSGKNIRMSVKPAPTNRGIIFVRTDLFNAPEIPAHFKNVVSTQLATTLGKGKVSISTVEHLLAALHGLSIDNAIVEVDGPEIPIMDGSSGIFYDALVAAGVVTQFQSKPHLALRKKVEIKCGEKWAFAEPAPRLEVCGSIEWDHPSIGYQEFHFQEGKTSFREFARARTFGFLKEVEALQKLGLAQGGSLENAIVLDDTKVLNPEGLRFKDEFVRHKVLDALGDFKLSGFSIQGYFRLHRAGHDLHRNLLAEIFKNPDHFEIMSGVEISELLQPSFTAAFTPNFAASI